MRAHFRHFCVLNLRAHFREHCVRNMSAHFREFCVRNVRAHFREFCVRNVRAHSREFCVRNVRAHFREFCVRNVRAHFREFCVRNVRAHNETHLCSQPARTCKRNVRTHVSFQPVFAHRCTTHVTSTNHHTREQGKPDLTASVDQELKHLVTLLLLSGIIASAPITTEIDLIPETGSGFLPFHQKGHNSDPKR